MFIYYSLKLVTSWLSFSGLQGLQRIYKFLVLGDYKSPHTLNVSAAYNFNPSITQTDAIPVTSTIVPLQYRINLAQQKCEALQLTIQDTPTSGTGEGLAISNMSLEAGIKKGMQKLPAGQVFG